MRRLTDFKEDNKFYRGTIITLKGAYVTPTGNTDIKYCMIGNLSDKFEMLDLYKSVGSVITLGLKTNVKGHFAVNKAGIKDWVTLYFNTFYTEDGKKFWIPKIDNILYIDNMTTYFVQGNRNLFLS